MATPDTLEGWIDRVEELMSEVNEEQVAKAFSGNAQSKATLQAWAVELHAALLFVAAQRELASIQQDSMVEVVNSVIDTIQGILMALGIALLLRKIRKRARTRRAEETETIPVSSTGASVAVGNRSKPRPSSTSEDSEKDATFLGWRVQWATHFVLTLLKALQLQEGADSAREMVWRARKDGATCSICRAMDGEKSIGGDFLPVILKKFPKYQPYVEWMGWPHAHPRCRCIAVAV